MMMEMKGGKQGPQTTPPQVPGRPRGGPSPEVAQILQAVHSLAQRAQQGGPNIIQSLGLKEACGSITITYDDGSKHEMRGGEMTVQFMAMGHGGGILCLIEKKGGETVVLRMGDGVRSVTAEPPRIVSPA